MLTRPLTRGGLTRSLTRGLVPAPVGNAPTVLTPPTITGDTFPGSVLTATDATFEGADTVTREWYKNGVATGETGTTYSDTASGDVVTLVNTATNSFGQTIVESEEFAVVDPLAGYSYDLRLQTHLGDNAPYGISEDRSLWNGFVGQAEQATPTQRFTLEFENDTPALNGDGTDDWMDVGVFSGQQVYTALIRSNLSYFSAYSSIIDTSVANEATRWGLFDNNTIFWHANPLPSAVRYDGNDSAAPFNSPDPAAWSVVTVKTAAGTSANRGIFQLQQSFFFNGRIIALAIHSGNPAIDAAQVIATEEYFETLKPTP